MAVLTPGLARTVSSIVDLVGNTPLIRLQSFESGLRNVELWAKAEWRNPGGSVKDRAASRMIAEGEKSGALTPDKILLDATSGNTGIAYAMIGAAKGFRVRLCVPANVTPERKRILKAFGAEVVYTDPMDGSDGAILTAKAMYAASPELYFYPDQYNNPANWRAHYDTTGPELLELTRGRITHFVSGLGTSGTFMGTGRRLREANPDVKLISVQPDSPLHGLEGLKHMDTAIVPGIYDPSLADADLGVSTEDAFRLTRELARQGLFVGISSGANLAGALEVARGASDAVIVVVFCDGGEKYLSERFWDEGSEGSEAQDGWPCASETAWTPRSAHTASRPIPTSAAAPSTGRTASSRPRSRCPIRRRRVHGAGFSCGRRTTGRPKRGRVRSGPSCSGSTTRIPITPRGRRSTTSTTRGRFFRTLSWPFAPACPRT